jgi:hypothetical protein
MLFDQPAGFGSLAARRRARPDTKPNLRQAFGRLALCPHSAVFEQIVIEPVTRIKPKPAVFVFHVERQAPGYLEVFDVHRKPHMRAAAVLSRSGD